MATYNGAAFLDEQLQSLLDQTCAAIDIIASDDGSTDATKAMLENWAKRWPKGKLAIVPGPGKGFAENFRSLLTAVSSKADYFAFCDQDDVWEPEKLAMAIDWLDSGPSGMPRLFCSRTRTIKESGEKAGFSPLFSRQPSFRNALVQSIAGGNTMVFNRAARDLLATASARSSFVSHDWWTYLMVTGAGGEVRYCTRPLVRYRQHGENQVGANTSPLARLSRLGRLWRGQFRQWSEENIAGLERNADLLTPEARQALDLFQQARRGSLPMRVRCLLRSGVYRQTGWGSLGLYSATVLNRL